MYIFCNRNNNNKNKVNNNKKNNKIYSVKDFIFMTIIGFLTQMHLLILINLELNNK